MTAQQNLHELELKMREMASRRLSPRESQGAENSNVQRKILTMEDKSLGVLAAHVWVSGIWRRDEPWHHAFCKQMQ